MLENSNILLPYEVQSILMSLFPLPHSLFPQTTEQMYIYPMKNTMVRFIALLLLLTLSLAIAQPSEASFCRNSNDHSICVLSIKRSAKNYWEYRVVISIDGKKQPLEVYNCRKRIKINRQGDIVTFQANDPGEIICSFFKK